MAKSLRTFDLYPYQKRWISDRSRFKVGCFSRQSGKTTTTGLEINDSIHIAESKGERQDWVILSRGERQAREAIEKGVKPFAKAYRAIIQEMQYTMVDSTGQIFKTLEVTYPNGSRVLALPSTPDTARGFSANVFLDEFAFHEKDREIWKAVFPVASKGHRIIVTSTPNGKGNKFYELMTASNLEGIWSRHRVDIYKAVADGLPFNIDQLRIGLNDDDAWRQEYELEWLDEASAWLSYDLISTCEHPMAGMPEHYDGGDCYVGVDIGIRKDLFVIVVLEKTPDCLFTREIIAKQRISFAEQDELLASVFSRYRVAGCCIDQTGLGEKPVEDAINRHGTIVQGVIMNSASKLEMATLGKQTMQDRLIKIPQGDSELREDMHKLKKLSSATGAPRFVAESDSKGHADRTWAMFLAIKAANDMLSFRDGDIFIPTPIVSIDGILSSYQYREGLL